jgi:CBS domain-containing protein
MTVMAADLESSVTELVDEAFEAFCEDVSSMFGADMQCKREHIGIEAVANLHKRFKKLAAVHLVQATGVLNGTFQLVFDQGGLFILSGIVVMLPENRIKEQVKSGQLDEAENLTDAAREVGNLLIGSWDRVFREGSEGHEHFVKTSTYIGKPWEHLEEVALSADEEVLLAGYEITVDSYPSFHCAAVLPKGILSKGGDAAETEPEPAPAEAKPAPKAKPETAPRGQAEELTAASEAASPAEPAKATPVEPAPPEQEQEPAAAVAEPERVETSATANSEETQDAPEPEPAKVAPTQDAPTFVATAVPAGQATSDVTLESTVGLLSDERTAALIDQVFQEHAVYPSDSGFHELLNVPARDIMTKSVVWCGPDDAVQDVIAAMQQHNTGYVLVGHDQVLEGLVSNSNILGALSPYLRPTFAKWRRPEDDATLGIKIKWVMTRPVRTIKPDVSLAAVIENMRRYGGRCLPVTDGQKKVLGIITVFDILLRILEADGSSSWQGSPPQGPPLMI